MHVVVNQLRDRVKPTLHSAQGRQTERKLSVPQGRRPGFFVACRLLLHDLLGMDCDVDATSSH